MKTVILSFVLALGSSTTAFAGGKAFEFEPASVTSLSAKETTRSLGAAHKTVILFEDGNTIVTANIIDKGPHSDVAPNNYELLVVATVKGDSNYVTAAFKLGDVSSSEADYLAVDTKNNIVELTFSKVADDGSGLTELAQIDPQKMIQLVSADPCKACVDQEFSIVPIEGLKFDYQAAEL